MGKWVRIIDWLGDEFGIGVVVVGSPAEKERAGELIGACSGRVCNLAGKTTLAELAGVLHLSRLHIGVDSAAPHIAAAVGTPTVTLYGPSDWRYWAPPGERHRVVVAGHGMRPLQSKGVRGARVEPLPRHPDRGAGSGRPPRDPFGLMLPRSVLRAFHRPGSPAAQCSFILTFKNDMISFRAVFQIFSGT